MAVDATLDEGARTGDLVSPDDKSGELYRNVQSTCGVSACSVRLCEAVV
jgi:hypothetical protein